ncbi:MAG TPA: hypothetical protein VJI46_01865 [Candidatus Nanoarchaeia archaeon]|nr:hypothetical protein [Candidatus Nanoarchaeia archaeon]
MNKPMYVVFDTPFPGQDSTLARQVGEEYKGRTVGELAEKILDGRADEYNQNPYTAQEMQTASYIRDLLERANADPGKAQILARSNTEPPTDIPVKLDDKVADYLDRILKIDTQIGPSGEEQKYQKVWFSIFPGISGGRMALY